MTWDQILTRLAPQGDCHVWTGWCDPDGYGSARFDGRMRYVHRIVYARLVGPIPEGQHVHHRCGVKTCCAVLHLVLLPAGDHARMHKLRNHCRRGHSLVYIGKKRKCRVCEAMRHRERYATDPAFHARADAQATRYTSTHRVAINAARRARWKARKAKQNEGVDT